MNAIIEASDLTAALARYHAMCVAIEECHAVDEVKEIINRAVALEAYAHVAMNRDAEHKCAEIRVRAERKCGALLAEREMAKGTRGQSFPGATKTEAPQPRNEQTLADLGITYKQSSQWQRLAEVPEPMFEEALSEHAIPRADHIVARHGAALQPSDPIKSVNDDALWLCGSLRDFVRYGHLQRDPNGMLETMLPHMREVTFELAPQVAAWLGRLRP